MTQLHNLQRQFQQALLVDQPMDVALLRSSGVAQFGVYRIAYRARLRAALRDNFEVLPLVMGDDAFDALANAYISAHPSRHYSLRWYGHQLCEFMSNNAALLDHPAFLDLARMEWALRQAFDAAHADPLTSEALTAVPASDWENLVFELHPSVQLLGLNWAIGPIWHALKSGQSDIDPPEALDHHILVWRLGMNTQWKSLAQAESDFVEELLAHRTFGQMCETLVESVGEAQAAATAVALLSELLKAGAICALPTRTPEVATS
jgi:Putative DNA-binding domain